MLHVTQQAKLKMATAMNRPTYFFVSGWPCCRTVLRYLISKTRTSPYLTLFLLKRCLFILIDSQIFGFIDISPASVATSSSPSSVTIKFILV